MKIVYGFLHPLSILSFISEQSSCEFCGKESVEKWRYRSYCVARCQVVNWPHYFFDCYAYASLKLGDNTIVGAFHHKIEDSIHGFLNVI